MTPLYSGWRCPRCGNPLLWFEATATWLSHMQCEDCLLAFYFDMEKVSRRKFRRVLVQGRKMRAQTAAA
jgi:hypothetical protein